MVKLKSHKLSLKRFHQTLKSLLHAYCMELDRGWEEGLPWLLLAVREVVQVSTGFSPNDQVFGHSVRRLFCKVVANCLRTLIDCMNGFMHRLYMEK